jgi:hypothetical protein
MSNKKLAELGVERRDYTIEEVKEMDQSTLISSLELFSNAPDKRTGTAELSRIIGVNQKTIWNYVQCLYLEPETQAMIGRNGDNGNPFKSKVFCINNLKMSLSMFMN